MELVRKINLSTRARLIIATLALLVVAFGLLALRNDHPHEIAVIPECPSQSIAGVYCPGCGSLRATHHLLNGRVSDSLAQNPLMLIAGVPVAALGLIVLGAWVRDRPLPGWLSSRRASWALIAVGAVLVVFGVVRNIEAPWTEPLRPSDQREPETPVQKTSKQPTIHTIAMSIRIAV